MCCKWHDINTCDIIFYEVLVFDLREIRVKSSFPAVGCCKECSTPAGWSNTILSAPFTETVTKTYPQNWAAYNEAQRSEYRVFMELLADLRGWIADPDQGIGRPSKPLSDMVYAYAQGLFGILAQTL